MLISLWTQDCDQGWHTDLVKEEEEEEQKAGGILSKACVLYTCGLNPISCKSKLQTTKCDEDGSFRSVTHSVSALNGKTCYEENV